MTTPLEQAVEAADKALAASDAITVRPHSETTIVRLSVKAPMPRVRATVYERAERSKDQAPDPIPNTGGLLPLFFAWDWEPKYRKAMELIKHSTSWEPPSYGLSADEWPTVPGNEPVEAFPKLRLIASNGEIVADNAPALI